MRNEAGLLVVVSGPSGAGKSTVIAKLMEQRSDLAFSISATTRKPREGERDGVDYHFMDRSQFEALIGTGEFLEHAEYVGNLYGTPRSPAVKLLGDGVSVILDIEVQGAALVKVSMPESVSVFLMPPSLKELERRLRSRGTESDDRISRRLVTARDEFARAGSYDYIVINGDSDKAAAELSAIVSAEKCRAPRRLPILEEALRSV